MVNEIEAEIESLPLRKLLVTLFNIISTEVFPRVMSIEIRKNSPKGVCVCVCVYVCVCVCVCVCPVRYVKQCDYLSINVFLRPRSLC